MTTYHGGKQRIGKQIANVIYDTSILIEQETDFIIKGYCEPFCDMIGVYKHIPKLFENHKPELKYEAGDINKSVIMMWQEAQKGWKPSTKKYTLEMFNKLKYNNKCSAEKGFVGHMYTYRSVFFDSYFPHIKSKVESNVSNIINTSNLLKNINFLTNTYYSHLKGYIIYCDPPYYNTNTRYYDGKGYKNRIVFDNKEFLEWCIKMSKNNIVFISEYSLPKNFYKIWEKNKEKLYIMF